MTVLVPGATTVDILPTAGPDGVLATPDSAPTIVTLLNGAIVTGIATVGSALATGLYPVTIVTPATWLPGDVFTIVPSAVFGSVTYNGIPETYQVTPTAANLKLTAAQTISVSGFYKFDEISTSGLGVDPLTLNNAQTRVEIGRLRCVGGGAGVIVVGGQHSVRVGAIQVGGTDVLRVNTGDTAGCTVALVADQIYSGTNLTHFLSTIVNNSAECTIRARLIKCTNLMSMANNTAQDKLTIYDARIVSTVQTLFNQGAGGSINLINCSVFCPGQASVDQGKTRIAGGSFNGGLVLVGANALVYVANGCVLDGNVAVGGTNNTLIVGGGAVITGNITFDGSNGSKCYLDPTVVANGTVAAGVTHIGVKLSDGAITDAAIAGWADADAAGIPSTVLGKFRRWVEGRFFKRRRYTAGSSINTEKQYASDGTTLMHTLTQTRTTAGGNTYDDVSAS